MKTSGTKKPKILLIIPAFNEQESISTTLDTVSKAPFDYIIINDGSTDDTVSVLKKKKAKYIDLVFNLGIGGAVQTGYKYAYENDYDIAVQFDADGQHDINSVHDIIQPIIDDKADFVIGSRFINKRGNNFKSSFLRRAGIRLISFIIYLFTRKRIYDTTSGFRAANKAAISYFIKNYPREYPEPISDYELIKRKYRVVEVSAKMHERKAGKSSIHSWKSAYYVINVILSIMSIAIRRQHD